MLSALVLAACGGSKGSGNGVASKSAEAIFSAASSAMANLRSVHVSGTLPSAGSRTSLDLSLVSGKGGRGSVAQDGLGFQLVALDRQLYINGSPRFWQQFRGKTVAHVLGGKWLKAPAGGQFASLTRLIDARTLFGQLVHDHGALTKGKATTVRGHPVIGVNARGGTVYVATDGKPYPIEIVNRGSAGGKVDFDRFNQPVALAAPAHAIDLSQREPSSPVR